MAQLWNTPSSGRFMSTMSGTLVRMSGRNMRSVALPNHRSSMGGSPTMVVAYTGSRRCVMAVTWNAG